MDTKREYKRPESVLVIVHTNAGQVLLLQRVAPTPFWQSVTGSLRWNEHDPVDAAHRELFEETGIRHTKGLTDWHRTYRFEILPAWRMCYAPGVTHNVEHLFSVRLSRACEIALNPSEHSAYQWVDLDSARRLVWSWTNREGIGLALEDVSTAF